MLPTTNGSYIAIANPLFELLELHEQQMAHELAESESTLCKPYDQDSPKETVQKCKSSKKDKSKSVSSGRPKEKSKDPRCTCKSKSSNVFR
jgi:hypothetical protein